MSKWKDSKDIIERTAYWINWLSPHNLWKAKPALEELLAQARESERGRILAEVNKMFSGIKNEDDYPKYCACDGECFGECQSSKDHSLAQVVKLLSTDTSKVGEEI